MNKILLVIIAMSMSFAVPALATPPVDTQGGTNIQRLQDYGGGISGGYSMFSGKTNYVAGGNFVAYGSTDATGKVRGHATLGGGMTKATVKGVSMATGDRFSHVEAGGLAAQGTFSGKDASQATASASEESMAGYHSSGRTFADGKAKTIGGSSTLAGTSRTGETSYATALTGSRSLSKATGRHKLVGVAGAGEVSHSEFSQNNHAFAWTAGSAKYSYSAHGHRRASGSGIAATVGSSSVSSHGNRTIAHSESFSVSQEN